MRQQIEVLKASAVLSARAAWALAALALAACTTTLNVEAPSGFDLSGAWVLDEHASDAAPDIAAIRKREDYDVARGRQSNASASAAFVVQDFPVLSATAMYIEQSKDSMGIRYDDNIYRDVSWGLRQRDFWQVQAGWSEGALVVRSKRDGVEGIESMTLEQGGRVLRVVVAVDTDGGDVRIERVFRRR